MEQVRVFNNGAIPILEAGYFEEAKDVLRAALETKKAHDRGDLAAFNQTTNRCVTPECIFVAEYHLSNRSTYMSSPRSIPGSRPSLSTGGFLNLTSGSSQNMTSPDFTMHLFAIAFPMETNDGDYASAVTVFNLALVHHLQDSSSTKARGLYEVAASMLALEEWDEHSALLRAAVTNNFAIWTCQNGQFGASRAALLELARMVITWPGDTEQADGFTSNLRLLDFFQGAQDEEEKASNENDDEDEELQGDT